MATAMEKNIQIGFTKAQKRVFYADKQYRFKTIAKGRRLGFTRGCAQYCILEMINDKSGVKMVLWVDTVQGNLENYFNAYFMPILRELPSDLWSYNKQSKQLNINGAILHLRSAERPENIEGLGYDLIILNEAGIILNDARGGYLWDNAISPMLLDNPNSRAIIGGVPKGRNKFYELAKRGGQNWKHYQFTSFDNPLLNKDEIARLVDEMGGINSVVCRQEIYGEFVDGASNRLFDLGVLEGCFSNTIKDGGEEVWAVDVARFGDDKSVIIKRSGHFVYSVKFISGADTFALSSEIYAQFVSSDIKPARIFIDSVGVGAGVFDRCANLGLPAREAIGSAKPIDNRYKNRRAEMYFNLSQKLKTLTIADGNHKEAILKQAASIEYFYDDKGRVQILGKDKIKALNGFSPDELDALAMLFYEPVLAMATQNYDEWSGDGY